MGILARKSRASTIFLVCIIVILSYLTWRQDGRNAFFLSRQPCIEVGTTNIEIPHKSGENTQTPGIPLAATIGKVTVSFGGSDETFERAIYSHQEHNRERGYAQFVLKERLLGGLWSKHAYIFTVLSQELSKPENERLKWLMWLDRDTVLMNPHIPLDIFLPPSGFEHINVIVTNDRHGLNNGVFFLRVCEWSLRLFTHAMSLPFYRPEVKLIYSEQSAMEELLNYEHNRNVTARVPQRWFNAFPPPPPKRKEYAYHARPGALLIHFASDRDGLRHERMERYLNIADSHTSEWRVPFEETGYPREIEEYWKRVAKGEDIDTIIERVERRK